MEHTRQIEPNLETTTAKTSPCFTALFALHSAVSPTSFIPLPSFLRSGHYEEQTDEPRQGRRIVISLQPSFLLTSMGFETS